MIKELEKKSKDELEKLHGEMLVSLRNFRFSLAGSKTRNLKEGENLRKDIARIKTRIKEISNSSVTK